MRPLAVASIVWLAAPAASLPSAAVLVPARALLQEPDPGCVEAEVGDGAPPASQPATTLSDEDRETLERLHSVLAEEGRAAALELLRETVRGFVEPEPGKEAARIAFLLELDRSSEELGSLEESLVLCGSILDLWTRLLPPDHTDLLEAKESLATTRYALGDFDGARELEEAVLEARARLLPRDHPDLLAVQQSLATTRYALGDLAGARELQEAVLEAWTRLVPPDDLDLLATKGNLAATRYALGDLEGARELEEAVLEARARLHPPDHPDLLRAKQNLAATRYALGDLPGARELEEAVLEARARLLPPDHPDLLAATLNLAATRHALGDLAGADEFFRAVHEAQARLLPPDHPDLLMAKQNLAVTRGELGDLDGARELEEAVLEASTRLLPPDHPDLLRSKRNLASTRKALGDPAGARELEEAVHEARARLLPADHPELLAAKQSLALTRKELGDVQGAHELVSSLLAGLRQRAGALRSDAARPAREGARAGLHRLAEAFFLGQSADSPPALEGELFATLENLRLASVASVEAAQALAARPELAQETRALAALRSRLNDLAAAGPEEGAADEWRRSLLELSEERDRSERRLRTRLAEAGAFVGEIDAGALAGRLEPGTAAVSFLRYARRFEEDPETGETPSSEDALLAFVVKPDGAVRRVELGTAAELEALVQDWRRALGKPIERGIAADRDGERSEADIGRALRERVLDPLLTAAGEDVRALHVVLDDVLFLVPLDALPLEGELRVGERLSIHVEPTLARLLREQGAPPNGALVALGGIDFEAELEPVASSAGAGESMDEPQPVPSALLAAATPPGDRSGRPEQFEPLRQTRYEIEDVVAQYKETLGGELVQLSGAAATKAALFAAAPRTRFLHLATHGWFASESFKSQLDTLSEQGARDSWARAEETLTGFAPETLCGLALAGANRGKDALGRVPGILTAEELASFDLRNCELAVLSACETNVGIRRAGQGIQSLQTALHAAGARTAITSLWKVDDAATRRLFELFYTKLWKQKLGKADALWQAKMALRAEGHPPRDWAGWILSGDPD